MAAAGGIPHRKFLSTGNMVIRFSPVIQVFQTYVHLETNKFWGLEMDANVASCIRCRRKKNFSESCLAMTTQFASITDDKRQSQNLICLLCVFVKQILGSENVGIFDVYFVAFFCMFSFRIIKDRRLSEWPNKCAQ